MHTISRDDLNNHSRASAPPQVKHISQMFDLLVESYLRDPREILGYPTLNWHAFNQAFGGARRGEVITVTGETGCGKTTFAINWLLDTIRQKKPSLLISLEIQWFSVLRQLAQMIQDKPFEKFGDTDIAGVGGVLRDLPLYVLDVNGMVPDKLVLTAIDYAVTQHAVQFVVLDHLDYINKTRGQSWQNESYVIGDFMRDLCGKAHELNTTIVVIAHPSKTMVKGVGRREIGLDELKGSSSIKQESDAVFGIYQPDPSIAETRLRFLKIRATGYSENTLSYLRFSFSKNTLKLTELSTQPEWGN